MNQEQAPNQRNEFRNFVGVVVFVARSLAVSVEVFLHKPDSFGERYLGVQAAVTLLFIFFWPVLCEPIHDPAPMLVFLLAYMTMCAAVRSRIAHRRRHGLPQPHTRYNGIPRLTRFTGRMDEVKVKGKIEPLFTFILGGFMLALSPPLGGYLMVASLGLMLSNGLAEEFERKRANDMHDAYLEQRSLADRFRGLRRD